MTQEIIISQGDYHGYNKLVRINTLCVGLQSGLNLNESGVGIVKCERIVCCGPRVFRVVF